MLKRITVVVPVLLGLTLFLAVLAAAALAAPVQPSQEQGVGIGLRLPVGQEPVTGTTTMTETGAVTETMAITETNATTETVTEPGVMTGTTTTGALGPCAQTYVVQANDSLSSIANQFLGSPGAYTAIVEATNAAASTNPALTPIDNPDFIAVGQTVCIPAAPGATTAVTGTMAPGETPVVGVPSGIPQGQGQLLFENLGAVDLIVDLIGPVPQSFQVGPGVTQTLTLEPGSYQYNAHQPGGAFVVSPGSFEIAAGRVTRLSCSTAVNCEAVQLALPQMQPGGAVTGTVTITPTTQPAQMEPGGAVTPTGTVQPSATVTATESMTTTQ